MAEVPDINPETAAMLARAIVDKSEAERPHAGIEFVSVASVTETEGIVPMVTVEFAGSVPGDTMTIPCLTGEIPRVGSRVAVIWDPPAGCYVIGSVDLLAAPTARLSLACESTSS